MTRSVREEGTEGRRKEDGEGGKEGKEGGEGWKEGKEGTEGREGGTEGWREEGKDRGMERGREGRRCTPSAMWREQHDNMTARERHCRVPREETHLRPPRALSRPREVCCLVCLGGFARELGDSSIREVCLFPFPSWTLDCGSLPPPFYSSLPSLVLCLALPYFFPPCAFPFFSLPLSSASRSPFLSFQSLPAFLERRTEALVISWLGYFFYGGSCSG